MIEMNSTIELSFQDSIGRSLVIKIKAQSVQDAQHLLKLLLRLVMIALISRLSYLVADICR